MPPAAARASHALPRIRGCRAWGLPPQDTRHFTPDCGGNGMIGNAAGCGMAHLQLAPGIAVPVRPPERPRE